MTEQSIRKGQDKNLRKLMAAISSGVGETLGSLIDRPLKIQPGTIDHAEVDEIVLGLDGSRIVARGALDKAYAGHRLCVAFTVPDAIALAGMMMMTPDEVVGERRKGGEWLEEDEEVFGEVGNILFSGIDEVLRSKVKGDIGLRLEDHHLVKPGNDENAALGEGSLIRWQGQITVGSYPATEMMILMDLETAERWNNGPLLAAPDGTAGGRETTEVDPSRTAVDAADEESLEDIPAAPIQGVLAAYTGGTRLMSVLRRACRRVGLEIERHSHAEVPNPAAHRNGLVLLDIPAGEDRRFDWCKRLKIYESNTTVILIVHEPSRARVLQAFMAKADFILGWPVADQHLAAKLSEAIQAHGPLPPPTPVREPTDGDTPDADKG